MFKQEVEYDEKVNNAADNFYMMCLLAVPASAAEKNDEAHLSIGSGVILTG